MQETGEKRKTSGQQGARNLLAQRVRGFLEELDVLADRLASVKGVFDAHQGNVQVQHRNTKLLIDKLAHLERRHNGLDRSILRLEDEVRAMIESNTTIQTVIKDYQADNERLSRELDDLRSICTQTIED